MREARKGRERARRRGKGSNSMSDHHHGPPPPPPSSSLPSSPSPFPFRSPDLRVPRRSGGQAAGGTAPAPILPRHDENQATQPGGAPASLTPPHRLVSHLGNRRRGVRRTRLRSTGDGQKSSFQSERGRWFCSRGQVPSTVCSSGSAWAEGPGWAEEGRGLFEDGGERGRRRRRGDSEWWFLMLLLSFSLFRTLFFSFAGFTPCRMRKKKRKAR